MSDRQVAKEDQMYRAHLTTSVLTGPLSEFTGRRRVLLYGILCNFRESGFPFQHNNYNVR